MRVVQGGLDPHVCTKPPAGLVEVAARRLQPGALQASQVGPGGLEVGRHLSTLAAPLGANKGGGVVQHGWGGGCRVGWWVQIQC